MIKKYLFLVLILLFSIDVSSAADYYVDACGIISSSGIYILTQNITNSTNTTCIAITTSNVTFDGNGYMIDGVDTTPSYGIYVYNASFEVSNVTIQNLTVSDWYHGIVMDYSNSNTLMNNTIYSNEQYGIFLWYSNNNNLTNNIIYSNVYGIYLYESSNNTLTNNTVYSNPLGVQLQYSDNNSLVKNTALRQYYPILGIVK